MNLSALASHYMGTQFDAWNESDNEWILNWSTGYVGAMDRFQTIYSRPLHLRTFGFPLDTEMPVSGTIRVHGDTDVYVLGQVREDFHKGSKYQKLVAGRLCSGLGGGLCEIHRKVPQTDDPAEGMYLVDTVVSSHFCDTELFGIRADSESDQDWDESYIVVLPSHAEAVEDDYIFLGDRRLRVVAVYADSGFVTLRAEETADERVNVIYRVNHSSHTPGSGQKPTRTGTRYLVTGIIRDYKLEKPSPGKSTLEFNLFIKRKHIDVEPDVDGQVEYRGLIASIFSVEFDSKLEEWCLKCRT